MKINGDVSHDEICELIKNHGLTEVRFKKAIKKIKDAKQKKLHTLPSKGE